MSNISTCHFSSKSAALRYYRDYGYLASDIDRKLAAEEIVIGRPPEKEGHRIYLNSEQRYCYAELSEKTVNGFTKPQFISYLETTLIPDLKSSGYEATAEDFETAVAFMR